jgi:hypothetical protein
VSPVKSKNPLKCHDTLFDDALDFSVTDRHQIIQLDYRAPVAPGVSWFASAALHKNWGNAAGVDNRMLFAGLVAQF